MLHGLNPERVLVAAEAIGIGRVALERASRYARERVVFGRPIGQNQGIQHPLAKCWAELEAANLMVMKAAWLYDNERPCGAEANAAKYLAGEAGFRACEQAVMTHGGMGYAQEYHVERYLRESLIPAHRAGQSAADPELPGGTRARPAEIVLNDSRLFELVADLVDARRARRHRQVRAGRARGPDRANHFVAYLMTTPPPSSIRCGSWVNRLEKPRRVFDRSNRRSRVALERGGRVGLVNALSSEWLPARSPRNTA